MRLPRVLVEKLRSLGLDIESVVVELLLDSLKLNPIEEAWVRLELARRFIEEARTFLDQGDSVQASEKLYKVVEECVKILAVLHQVPELEEVKRRGRWDTWILGRASSSLARVLGEERIRVTWALAYDVHVWGFHEAKYTLDDVKPLLPYVEWLLDYTRNKLEERRVSNLAWELTS